MKLFKNDGEINDKLKEQLINKYPTLTENDFDEKNEEKLMMHLQQKLGKSKKEMKNLIRSL